MDTSLTEIARTCLDGAETGTMTFARILGTLTRECFESYAIDFRRGTATYYLPGGDSVLFPTRQHGVPIADTLDVASAQAAIREAQQLAAGYTHAGFCAKVMAAGCAGYIVSFTERRAVYFGRTAETHVEHFPR